jgi:hypothetical protein
MLLLLCCSIQVAGGQYLFWQQARAGMCPMFEVEDCKCQVAWSQNQSIARSKRKVDMCARALQDCMLNPARCQTPLSEP